MLQKMQQPERNIAKPNERKLKFNLCRGDVTPAMWHPKLYTPSTLNIDFIQWHTQLNVCAVK